MLLMMSMGIAFALAGVLLVRPTIPAGWVTTDGVIVDAETYLSDGQIYYAPIVEYSDGAGRSHRTVSRISSNIPPDIGTTVEVAYDPADPADARIVGGLGSWIWLAISAFGVAFAGVWAFMLIRLQQPRFDNPPAPLPLQPSTRLAGQAYRFERSPGRVLFDLLAAPLGALALLGGGVWWMLAGIDERNPMALVGGLVLVGFALFLAAAAVVSLHRGRERTMVEVGADGIWLPGMGALGWSQLADVRLETFLAPAGGRYGETRLARHRRLGVVPTDEWRVRERPAAERLTARSIGAFYRLAVPLVSGRPAIDPAPFGIADHELGQRFDELVARVRDFQPISQISDEAAPAQLQS